jgi:oligopeptide/dipeptide ABC transporter ATP-binding protein
MTPSVLSVRDLSVDFITPRGRVHALRRVNLEVPRGSVVGLVGESGSGKSTLAAAAMRLLAGNAEILGGTVDLDGTDVLHLPEAALAALRGAKVSMVFQDPMNALNPVLTIGRQMTDIQHRERALAPADKRRRAAEMLRRVGIADAIQRLDAYPHEFSGGMRQRIAIAMALLCNPALLIADEPTTALDVTLEAQIVHLLRELKREFQGSILFVSHNLGLVAELCDHVVILYAGTVVESGTVFDIFHHPRHPYTEALLQCDPARIARTRIELPTIPGDVPDLLRAPEGCVFAPRCPKALAGCATTPPTSTALTPTHSAACHLVLA